MKNRMLTGCLILAALASACQPLSAEPIVVRFCDESERLSSSNLVDVSAQSAGLPPLAIYSVNFGGGGVSEYQPQVAFFDFDEYCWVCDADARVFALLTDDTHQQHPGLTIQTQHTLPGIDFPGPDAVGDWGVANEYCGLRGDMPTLVTYVGDNIGSCDWNTPGATEDFPMTPVLHYPIRLTYTGPQGETNQYGWFAVQAINRFDPNCHENCGEFGGSNEWEFCTLPLIVLRGFGFESDLDTPIVIGGGLNAADVNFDAILDLTDIQAFTVAFTAMQPSADFDDNGLYDLADILYFITSFNTPCGL